jgi:hypothetical protein
VGGEVSQNWVWRREPPGELKQQRLGWAVVLWQESWGEEGQEEKGSREFMFVVEVPARTDWEAPRAENAYLDKERRDGIVSARDSRMGGDEDG